MLDTCLETLGISLLSEWDVLTFLYRHSLTLANADDIAQLLGYRNSVVGNALDRLESLGVIQRSRASEGVRLRYFSVSIQSFSNKSFQEIMNLSDQRNLRLLVSKNLGVPRAAAHRGKVLDCTSPEERTP